MYYMIDIIRGILVIEGIGRYCTLVSVSMILFYFVLLGRRVLVIGIWLGTYIGGIVILVIGYIGLGLGFVIRGILFCLLGGSACGLGIFSHCV